uniref:(northern house mosquito) hypothetical protein n=1 Tax=Culex pipiens TaxID=7175 RepID=A0A8D8DJH0_CULPI
MPVAPVHQNGDPFQRQLHTCPGTVVEGHALESAPGRAVGSEGLRGPLPRRSAGSARAGISPANAERGSVFAPSEGAGDLFDGRTTCGSGLQSVADRLSVLQQEAGQSD